MQEDQASLPHDHHSNMNGYSDSSPTAQKRPSKPQMRDTIATVVGILLLSSLSLATTIECAMPSFCPWGCGVHLDLVARHAAAVYIFLYRWHSSRWSREFRIGIRRLELVADVSWLVSRTCGKRRSNSRSLEENLIYDSPGISGFVNKLGHFDGFQRPVPEAHLHSYLQTRRLILGSQCPIRTTSNCHY